MNWLNRLAGFTRSAPGLEWWIWKRLPAVLMWGTALPLAVALAEGGWAATTVSATMIAAQAAGIRVFATGGIKWFHPLH